MKSENDSKQRIRICLAYDGTGFWGWQKQPNHEGTIQGVLEKTLSKLTNQEISVVGSGRTDRGVHALRQWAHFDLPDDHNLDLSNLRYTLNRMTPESLWIKNIELAPAEFHAQISCETKCYKYRLLSSQEKSPFCEPHAWVLGRDVDLGLLQAYANEIVGSHDFTSFQSQGTPVSTPVREILKSRWKVRQGGLIVYQIQGTGFLKQMVRNLVGTMIKLEQFQAPVEEFKKVLQGRNRSLAAAPAPPQGLFLTSVQYPEDLDNKCRKL